MSVQSIRDFRSALEKSQILEGLTSDELKALGEVVRYEEFGEGAEILTEGKVYQGLWVLLKGKCEVVKCNDSCSVLATFEPGSVFGEMSFFETAPHSATVKCCEPSIALCLTKEQYDFARKGLPQVTEKIAINLVRILSSRLRKMDEWTCELVNTDANQNRHQEWHEFRSRLYSDIYDA
ncbi:DNA-binding transcriptional dual regulator Crp [Thalassoglobus neptunius]|uniref:DNA-binding transcriptional dual regulator Crp n=1 Tax=Thalassoglobus neptunius TaxID=1938619 RepID=A0A5C5X5S0_9PLAN|nr:cyclic nucleotide-binding domain-containing protein [Thalassoglobus neptunius]TWT58108.1 DNA-binding transcriptional dual regulator Crp [Thalassoglobus neptunius]